MIIWLASYPKSGNTLIRSMLSAYLFSKDGVYNFDIIKNIRHFPNIELFEKLNINPDNDSEIIKNYVNVQNSFNDKNSIQFLKTHSYLFNIDNNAFTNLKNSLGAIYIVRDPRNVVTSWSKFANVSIQKAADTLIKTTQFGGNLNVKEDSERSMVHMGTWNGNFQSWKSFKYQGRYLLIKYEDLIKNREENFLKVLKFIFKLQKTKFYLNKSKFDNVIETTDFEKLKKLEKEKGFFEAKTNKKTGEKIPFFNLGPKNNWKTMLIPEIRTMLEKAFKKEMRELGYL